MATRRFLRAASPARPTKLLPPTKHTPTSFPRRCHGGNCGAVASERPFIVRSREGRDPRSSGSQSDGRGRRRRSPASAWAAVTWALAGVAAPARLLPLLLRRPPARVDAASSPSLPRTVSGDGWATGSDFGLVEPGGGTNQTAPLSGPGVEDGGGGLHRPCSPPAAAAHGYCSPPHPSSPSPFRQQGSLGQRFLPSLLPSANSPAWPGSSCEVSPAAWTPGPIVPSGRGAGRWEWGGGGGGPKPSCLERAGWKG